MLVLVDLDGTVYTRSGLIDGAVAALAELRAAGHVLRFLTNTDSHPTASLLATLVERGVPVHEGELFTSVTAAEALLATAGEVRVLPVTNEAVAAEFAAHFPIAPVGAATRWAATPAGPSAAGTSAAGPSAAGAAAETKGTSIPEGVMPTGASPGAAAAGAFDPGAAAPKGASARGLVAPARASAPGSAARVGDAGVPPAADDAGSAVVTHVVVGDVRSTLSYELLDAAFRALRAGAELVAMQKGRFYLDDAGAHIDTGAVVAALEFAAGVPATVVGKPSVAFLELAARSAERPFPPDQICVVGDDVLSDVRMGRDAGARTVLVRTGKYSLQRDVPDGPVPDREIDSLAALPSLLRSLG